MNTELQVDSQETLDQESTFGGIPILAVQTVKLLNGLPGFEELHDFVLAELEGYAPFCAFRSLEEEDISMLVLDAKLLTVWDGIEIPPRELAILGLNKSVEADQYVILKIDQSTQEFTANIKAPIVINSQTGVANQVILDNSNLSVEHPMQNELK